MEHLKKYWWVYLILIVAIYFGWKWYKGNAKDTSGNPKPINGSCPAGYLFYQPTTPFATDEIIPGVCVPLSTNDTL